MAGETLGKEIPQGAIQASPSKHSKGLAKEYMVTQLVSETANKYIF